MEIVLNFDLDRHEFRKRATSRTDAGAQILFFTGVRYERYEEAPMIARATKRPASTNSKNGSLKPTRKRRA